MMGRLRLRRAPVSSEFGSRLIPSDEGAALVLALVFLLFVSLIVAAIMTFVDTNFRATIAIRDQRRLSYFIDGAGKGAINYVRGNVAFGKDPAVGGSCPTFTTTNANSETAIVTCQGLAGSGVSSAGSKGIDFPNYALLTLGDAPSISENGISAGSNGDAFIDGDIFSNSNIDFSPGNLSVTGTVGARYGCSGNVTSTGVKNCAQTTAEADPGYAARATLLPSAGTFAPCSSGDVIVFSPGAFTYTLLNSAINTCPGSANPKLYFPPGVYYFDFSDRPSPNTGIWDVPNNQTIVGGLANGWDPAASSEPVIPFPGGCRTDVPGTQFIFGKTTRFNVGNTSNIEICSGTNSPAGGQQIALYGFGPKHLVPTSATNLGAVPFLPTSSALSVDGISANATLSNGPNNNATLRLTGYATSSTVPAGSIIDAVILRVIHSETNQSKVATLKVTATVGAVSNVTNLTASSPLHEDDFDLTSTFSAAAFSQGVTVTYGATRATGGSPATDPTVSLDNVQLLVGFHAPGGIPAQSGCVWMIGGCGLISTGSGSPNLAFHGTVYAPWARLDLHLTSSTNQVFGRGAIVRSVTTPVTPSSSSPPSFGLPNANFTEPRKVLFTASINGAVRLRALVAFDDLGGASPGDDVTVISWEVIRG